NSTVDYGCVIGSRVRVHTGVYIAQFTVIEDDVFLAPGVMIANDRHPICRDCMRGPTIKRAARVGINATLLPEIVVGEAALVGAGLSALELALRALRIGPGDEVITQANTFIASAGAILAVGARPVLVDCDDDGVIRPDAVRAVLTPATRAIMPVHLFGRICDI